MQATTRLSRQEQREATRARLLAAGAEVFAARGFHGASVEEIAEAAGFTKGAVYSNFDSKEDLFLAVLEDRVSGHVRGYTEALATGRPYDDLLDGGRPWMMLLMEFWLHAMRNPEARYKLAARHRVLRETLARLVEQQAAQLGVELPGPSQEIAAVLLALSQGLALQRLVDPTGVPDDLFPRALDYLVESLR